MKDIGPWFDLTKSHLTLHWQKHLPPLLAFVGGSFLIAFLVVPLMICTGMASSILGGITGSETVTLAVMIIGFGLFFVILVGMLFALMPLYLGYLRIVLKLHRGEPTERADLFWGFRHLGTVFGLLFLQMAITLPAAMLCYFPAFLVGTALFFSFMVAVDRELGPIDCMKASWVLVKPRFIEILVTMLILVFGMTFLAYIPVVGTILGTMAFVAAMVVIYDDLVQREHFNG